jgi:NAD(P)-dependent dehydrogenase (short-subunit alcohol dehydrogenase family)
MLVSWAYPTGRYQKTGVEIQFAANYLGHFLLMNLLMKKMVSSAAHGPHGQTHIINITTAGHVLTPVRFSDYSYDGKPVPPEEQPDVTIAAKWAWLISAYNLDISLCLLMHNLTPQTCYSLSS